MVKEPVPATAVMVGVPPQPFTTFGAAASTRPAGNASLKVSAERAGDPAGLETVNVSVLVWPTPTVAGAKALVSAGRLCTVRPLTVTLLVIRASPLMLAAVLLYGPPGVLLTVSTRTWQEATPPLIDAPLPVTVPLPATAVTKAGPPAKAPPAGFFFNDTATTEICTLALRVALPFLPDCAGLPAPLVIVKVSVDVPPMSMTVGANALLSEACTTVSVWLVTPFT